MVAVNFIIGKCSEIIRKTKRRSRFFAEISVCGAGTACAVPCGVRRRGGRRCPEAACRRRSSRGPRVAVEDEEERHGRAGEPPQVDHADTGPQRPVGETHAVDVDQLEADGSRRRVAAPEDVAVVEIPVLDPLFVELHGEAGEGFQHGDRSGRGKMPGGLRQRRVVRVVRDVVAVAQQSVAAVFAPRDGFGRVDAQRPQPHGVFVGAAGLAPAKKV